MKIKAVALGTIYVAFTAAGIVIAIRSATPYRRLEGLGFAAFFGLAGALYFGRDLLYAGLRYRPAPPLRVGAAHVELDRLVLRAGLRKLLYFGAGTVFLLMCAVIGFAGMRGIGGAFEGTVASVAAAGMLFVIAMLAREPLIVFDPEELRWRLPLRGWRTLPYSSLAGGALVATANGESCGLFVRDLEAYFANLSFERQREVHKNLSMHGVPIVLPNAVAPNAEQVLELVSNYARFPATVRLEPGR